MNPTPNAGRRFATYRETAAYIGCNERTIRIWVEDGRLPVYRFGPQTIRVDLNDVDAMGKGELTGGRS